MPKIKNNFNNRHYDRCANPLKLENHHRTKSLSRVTENMKSVYPDLTFQEFLCTSCRKTIMRLRSSISLPKTPLYQRVTALNTAASPTSPFSAISGSDYARDVLPNELLEDNEIENVKEIPIATQTMLNSIELLNNLKKEFQSTSCTKEKKLQILTLLPKSWGPTEIQKHFNASKHMISNARELLYKKGILALPDSKKGHDLPDEVETIIKDFYTRNDTSALLPGMKDYIILRNEQGEKEKIQKRLLLLNLKELYGLFKEEFAHLLVGFTKFTLLRPQHCVLAGSAGTHSICVCLYHQNVKLILLGINISTLTRNEPLQICSYKDCFKVVLCNESTESCYFGNCTLCPRLKSLQNLLENLFEKNDLSSVTYKQWFNNPKPTLETVIKSTTDFIPFFCQKIKDFLPHAFIAYEQSKYARELKSILIEGEFEVTVDFAENYAFAVQNAIPGFHWNNDQATVYNIVIYYNVEGTQKHKSLVIISDVLSHDTVAVYGLHKILMSYLKTNFPIVNKIFYFSDGAPQQYKNYKNVINVAYHELDFGVKAEWNFFATAHGKGPCDALGATVKRGALRASLQSGDSRHILTCQDLYDWLSTTDRMPSIAFRFFSNKDYASCGRFLNARFKIKTRIDHLQNQHALIPLGNGVIRVKPYSQSQIYKDYKLF